MLTVQSIGIIGYGDFGKFLHELAQVHLPETVVKVSSSRFAPDGKTFFPLEEVCKADILILSVPISALEEVVKNIKPLLGENTVVCDVATVKKHTVAILRENNISRFIATHPMFGPSSYEKQGKSLKDLRIAVCDSTLSHDERAKTIEFFRTFGLNVLEMTPDEHDKLIAETLFLTHLVGQIVKKGKFERTSIDTISFGFLMDAAESVAHDDALFRDVFKYNPYCSEVLRRFEESEKEIVASLQVGQRA
ncbi:MAG: prephenate dehydrogenase/arogenate dehydrogenase family protein [Patescibacteria group bacterium]